MSGTTDFAEWLSPMVVKELRQGMRSRMFVISFLLLQGAMMFVAMIALAASASQQSTVVMTGFFWGLVGIPLMLIMPISGLGAVAGERRTNSLELIYLTRLTPRRIIAGKWLAIVAQTVLLVCAVLPYAVLRYFLGGVNLSTEFVTLGILLVASALLTGVTVGVSPQMSAVVRVLLSVGIFLALQFMLPLMSFMIGGFGGPVSRGPVLRWHTYVGFSCFAVLMLLLMLEYGASKIAPAAANHSTSRRLIGLSALVVVGLLTLIDNTAAVLIWGAVALLVPICIGALAEAPSEVASVYRPFVRFGLFGRLAGRLLYPGWQSGVLFTTFVLLLILVPSYIAVSSRVDAPWIWWTGMSVAGAVLMPAAIYYLFLQRLKKPLIIYIVIQALCAMLAAAAGMMYGFGAGDFRLVAAVIPTTGLLLSQSGAITDENVALVLIGTSLITVGSLILLLVRTLKPWREIRRLESTASALIATPSIDAPAPRPAQ